MKNVLTSVDPPMAHSVQYRRAIQCQFHIGVLSPRCPRHATPDLANFLFGDQTVRHLIATQTKEVIGINTKGSL